MSTGSTWVTRLDLPQAFCILMLWFKTLIRVNWVKKIGTLPSRRVRQILDGLQLLLEPYEFDVLD